MKIVTVVGARPQFIKMGPLSRLFRKGNINEVIVHTGQHYDYNLSEIFFKEFRLFKPKYNLGIKALSDISQLSLMLKYIEGILIKERPDLILTYGDTNSSLASALAGSKLAFPLAHVEAGVRGFDRNVPEEINRLIIDRVSALLFCPTKKAVENLKKEGIQNGVFLTGDVMAEVLREKAKNICSGMEFQKQISTTETSQCTQKVLRPPTSLADEVSCGTLKAKSRYVLVTLHRQENVDRKENLKEIVDAFCSFKGQLIFPIHPRTEKNLKRFKLWNKLVALDSLKILDPQGYTDFLLLQKNAARILTDSGGIQKEAYILKVPCLTLRTTTEWPETLKNGWNRLVPCRCSAILKALDSPLGHPADSNIQPAFYKDIFGSGKASERIYNKIISWFQKR